MRVVKQLGNGRYILLIDNVRLININIYRRPCSIVISLLDWLVALWTYLLLLDYNSILLKLHIRNHARITKLSGQVFHPRSRQRHQQDTQSQKPKIRITTSHRRHIGRNTTPQGTPYQQRSAVGANSALHSSHQNRSHSTPRRTRKKTTQEASKGNRGLSYPRGAIRSMLRLGDPANNDRLPPKGTTTSASAWLISKSDKIL